ncbi:Fpg/Nei family DNA glycosylase [Diaminobutyricimonas sp. LJ205]|uniref:Fpg/Nei family DNA glycosylase n=1 Tax=Diaminobutyricimonas sp. LJ205 TaxID=2683590 RepID=UPI0012F526B5|nr:DNA-formamidopyrimidine glycosylase family protein [Diaminobutyricimonas sp. LJ205]
MPEGHSVHRIARQFALHFVGHPVASSSPQGRFAAGAKQLDGRVMTEARAIGKQMFLGFEGGLWLRVHLGLYGAWDFAGDVTVDATVPADTVVDADGENSLHSIGAPRRTRLRMSEQEKQQDDIESFPPEPVGQVRVRLLTDVSCADLRGPTACEVLDAAEVDAVIARLGPDPLVDDAEVAEERFVSSVRKKSTPIGLLLMDQSVVSGIGNIYRAELLFRARLDPHTPGRNVPQDVARELWRDWTRLLTIGVHVGQMMTMDDLEEDAYRAALANRADRHWVYLREGLPCRVCGTNIAMEMAAGRKLYWCPSCQR